MSSTQTETHATAAMGVTEQQHPKPPYYAVIFTSTRITESSTAEKHNQTPSSIASAATTSTLSYAETVGEMFALAARQEGYLGHWVMSKTEEVLSPTAIAASASADAISAEDENRGEEDGGSYAAGDTDGDVHVSNGPSTRKSKTTSTTISYWRDQGCIAAWKANLKHAEARRRGKEEWYASWRIRVCKVEREYGSGEEWL